MALLGFLLGAVIGSYFIGGLFGWIIHKVTRQPYRVADAVGMIILVFLAGFTNSSAGRGLTETWTIYGIAGLAAFFILQRTRDSFAARSTGDAQPARPTAMPAGLSAVPPATQASPATAPMATNEAVEIGIEEDIAYAIRSEYRSGVFAPEARKRPQNFIARHWRGELPLAVSYWVINFVASIAGALAVTGLTLTFTPSKGYEPTAILSLLVLSWLVLAVILVWQIVGLWRCAERRSDELFKQRLSAFWPRAAQVMAALAVLQFAGGFANSGLPQLNEVSRIVFHNDPDIPDATLTIADDARSIALDGGIKYGLARQIQTLLDAAPNVTALELRSPGGRVAEAEKVFDLIRSRGLDTFVSDECSSACTLVFVGGTIRLVSQGGRLGFHGSYFPGSTAQELRDANEEWAALYREAGIDGAFLTRALSISSDDMWYPSADELRAARVTAGEVSLARNVPASFVPAPSIETMRSEFIAADTIYGLIDRVAPDRALQVYQAGLEYSQGQIDEVELRSRANAVIAELVRERIIYAPDDLLIEFASIAAAEYAELLATDAAACFAYVTQSRAVDAQQMLSEDILMREQRNNERIIASATSNGQRNEAAAETGWNTVALGMQRTLTPDQFNVYTNDISSVRPSDYGTYCMAAVVLMQEISKLPPIQAGAVVKSLFE